MDVLLVLWDDVGTADATPDVCPQLAALRASALDFELGFANPVCSQSRAVVLFGASGRRLGMTRAMEPQDTVGVIPPATWPTLPAMLLGAGFRTGLVGKWHCGRAPSGAPPALAPIERGFEVWRAGSMENLEAYRGWTRYDADPGTFTVLFELQYATSAQLAAAALWWDFASGPAPRFLQVSLNEPHGPVRGPANVPPEDLLAGWPTPALSANARAHFLAKLRAADTALGRLVEMVGPGTLVVLAADNGTAGNSASIEEDPEKMKGTCFDPGIRVPLVVRTAAGAGANTDLHHLVDVPSGILELLGIPRPTAWEGQSIPRPFVICEATLADGTLEQCARTKTHKLRATTPPAGLRVEQFYDLVVDPAEEHPLPSSQSPVLRNFLRTQLYGKAP